MAFSYKYTGTLFRYDQYQYQIFSEIITNLSFQMENKLNHSVLDAVFSIQWKISINIPSSYLNIDIISDINYGTSDFKPTFFLTTNLEWKANIWFQLPFFLWNRKKTDQHEPFFHDHVGKISALGNVVSRFPNLFFCNFGHKM